MAISYRGVFDLVKWIIDHDAWSHKMIARVLENVRGEQYEKKSGN